MTDASHIMSFRLVPPEQQVVMPWKNGGGITREIIKVEAHGRFLWRLSIADVTQDGPFSLHPGLGRVLTVIEGDGIDLVSPLRPLPARLLDPVAFSGDDVIEGRLVNGPIQDFNVIFDKKQVNAEVCILHPSGRTTLHVAETTALLFLESGCIIDGQRPERLEAALLPSGAYSLVLPGPAIRVDISALQH